MANCWVCHRKYDDKKDHGEPEVAFYLRDRSNDAIVPARTLDTALGKQIPLCPKCFRTYALIWFTNPSSGYDLIIEQSEIMKDNEDEEEKAE